MRLFSFSGGAGLQPLEKGDVSVHLGESQSLVEPDAQQVSNPGVAGEFGISPRRCPSLARLDLCSANAFFSIARFNKPSFQVRRWGDRSAIHMIPPQRYFRESNQLPLVVLGHKYHTVGVQQLADFQPVLVL